MALVSFGNLGQAGLLTDLAANELPLEGWTDASNVRFTGLGVEKVGGSQDIYGTQTVEPLYALPILVAGNYTWAYAGTTKLYTLDGTTQYNITRQTAAVDVDYAATNAAKWSGGNFNGIGIFNNGVDVPQSWIPTGLATKATDLANWTSGLLCQTLRPFKNFLVAMNLTVSGTSYPTSIRWSHPADPAAVKYAIECIKIFGK